MQADIAPLLVINMNPGFTLKSHLFRCLRLTVISYQSVFGFSTHHVIVCSGRHTLGKFSAMVRHQVPARMFLLFRSDSDFHTIKRPVIRPISSAEDQSVGLFFFRLVLACSCAKREERQKHTSCPTRGRGPAPRPFTSPPLC